MFLPGESHGRRSLVGYSPRGRKELDTTERLQFSSIEAEDSKKRWQEYTELYKKDLHDPDNHKGVIAHLEPDILEFEVK